jgi:hypothetical protein
MALFGRRRFSDGRVDFGWLDLDARDQQVIKSLMGAGANLDVPRHVRHYVYVPNEDDALLAARVASEAGWNVELVPPDGEVDHWNLVAERHGYVLTPAGCRADRALFEEVARDGRGDYDGWEASV